MTSAIERFYSDSVKHAADGRQFPIAATSLHLFEAEALRSLVVALNASRTLEIGLALGASSIAIVDGLMQIGGDGRHTVLDPYQQAFGHIGLGEIEREEFSSKVDFRPVLSEEFLREAAREGQKFNLIFHDGGHSIGQKVTDTFYADRCLEPGGIMAFHDAFLYATAACVRYLVKERAYELISLPADSAVKRPARMLRYALVHGRWYAFHVVPHTCRSLVAVRKTGQSVIES